MDLSSRKEHRIHVVSIHLLKLWVVQLLLHAIGVSSSVVSFYLHLVHIVHILLTLLRVYPTEMRQRAHWANHTFASLDLSVLYLHFHHLVSVFSSMGTWGNATHVLGDDLVELLSLLFIDIVRLIMDMSDLAWQGNVGSWAVQSSHRVVKGALVLRAVTTLNPLLHLLRCMLIGITGLYLSWLGSLHHFWILACAAIIL